MENYDFVIMGSGLGGLECGYILAKEGYSVCVLEKNQQFGGGLQTFKRGNVVFDTGVHYVGGLDKGQSLHKYFSFFDIIDKLKIKRLDENGFEHISFDNESKIYPYGTGHTNFIEQLAAEFPQERKNLEDYINVLNEVCASYPFYHLKDTEYSENFSFQFLDQSIYEYLNKQFSDKKLISILAGTNLLYAGNIETSTLYEHALIVNAYIESSYRFIDGAGQIANALVRNLRKLGATVKRYQKVTKIVVNENTVDYLLINNETKITGKNFISNFHPITTLNLMEGANIRKSYVSRLNSIKNSSSAFALHIVLEENSFPYLNYNVYHHKNTDVWSGEHYTEDNWPLNYMAFTPAHSKSDIWADSMIAIAYMRYDEVEKWSNIENTVGFDKERGKDYEKFKERKSQILLKEIYKRFPEIKGYIKSYCASTPLTYKDYLYSPEGSIYGYSKDYNNPILAYLSPQSKINNLFFTGQNINMHGVLGVTVSAFITCAEILDKKILYDKVRNIYL